MSLRIGIVNTENSHADHIIDHLNIQRADDARVVAISGGATERNEQLRAKGNLELVDEPADLLGRVDAVAVTDRHGDLHRGHAVPFLAAGVPVFIDKPLACTLQDAEVIVAAAREHDTPVTSYSALRWLPDTDTLAARASAVGTPQVVVASGPADPASPYGGICFYGIHPIDIAMRLAPGAIGEVRVDRAGNTVTASVPVGQTRVVVNLVAGHIPFHGLVVGLDGIAARTIEVGKDYVVPGLRVFLEMVRSGKPPIDYDDLLRPIRVLSAIADAIT